MNLENASRSIGCFAEFYGCLNSWFSIVFLAAVFSASTLLCSQASADDTEIFFADKLSAGDSTANVLFMFDNSGSMAWLDDTDRPRLSRLKESMIDVIESSENVNIGIGSFGGSNRGSIQLPTVSVDADMCRDALCTSIKYRGEIRQNDDDAEAWPNGNVDLNSLALDTTYKSTWNSPTTDVNLWALRFDDLNIPRGATINSANLQLISDYNYGGTTNISIVAEDADDSAPFTTANNNLGNRVVGTSPVLWTPQYWSGKANTNSNPAYISPDIGAMVNQIVNRPGWCGGNALTLLVSSKGDPRGAYTRDSDPYRAPVLQIDYNPSTIEWSDTCLRTKVESSITLGIDDVVQDISSGAMVADGDKVRTHIGTSKQVIGLRFPRVEVPLNATITAAYLSLPLAGSVDGDVDVTIEIEDTSYSTAINGATPSALTSRTYLGGANNVVSWENIPGSGSSVRSADISTLVSNIVSKAEWDGKGAMTFKLTPTSSGDGQRFFRSADSPSGVGARLIVHYQQHSADLDNTAPVLLTGRDEMIRTMLDYEPQGSTPLVDAYYEATQYMRGEAITYGDSSEASSYTRPEFGECKTNQIVMLSDGAATVNNSASIIKSLIDANPTDEAIAAVAAGDVSSDAPTCAVRGNDKEQCGIELARWMYETDHDDATDGDQPVITHNVGFNISTPFLTEMAAAGNGSFYKASSASELTLAFKNIIQSAITQDTGFVAPSSSISLTNRLVNSNELYFALFQPSVTTVWNGNLKRFQLGTNTTTGDLEIRDSLAAKAINANGSLSDDSKSFWSVNADGGSVAKGGAASNLTLTRTLYTSKYDSGLSKKVLSRFHEDQGGIDGELLGIQGQNDAYRTELMQWARGVDIKDYNGNAITTEIRKQMGDPMHSTQYIMHYPPEELTPATDTTEATYGEPRSLIFVGTNQGFLHAINTGDGSEHFAFIPEELLSNLDYFFRDEPVNHDQRPYGLDGEISGWHDDINGNGYVDGAEKAYIYVGMRRGGRNYYILNVTDPDNPILAGQVNGGTGNFAELGQTWSRPVKATVKYLGDVREVLFFAAGYDDSNDDETVRTADTTGRGFFMVDATDGAYLKSWGIGNFPKMEYSFPSDMRIINTHSDAYADAIFVGDTGGQIWRFDIDNSAEDEGKFISGAVIADFGGSLAAQNRQFFYEPDVALIKDPDGGMYLNIAVGSGSRPNPNSTTVLDSFYSIRDGSVFGPPRDGDGVIKYPTVITESDLANTSEALASEDNAAKLATGWFFRFSSAGEKALSTALTVDNELMFTTYVPAAPNDDICKATIGSGRIYILDVLNSDPISGTEVLSSRYAELKQKGIPPRVAGLIVDTAPNTVSRLVGMEIIGDTIDGEPFERTFWAEQ